MNLFVAGWSDRTPVPIDAAGPALDGLVAQLPFLSGEPRQTWSGPSGSVAATWVTHASDRVGGIRYDARETSRLALWSGRPVMWRESGEPDGRSPLDARRFLGPSAGWADRLDGRCTVVRLDDTVGQLEVFSDALGAYPVFEAAAAGVNWISNNAEVLRALSGTEELDETVLACLLGGGWSLSGHPLWRAVRRIPRGTVQTLGRDGGRARELLPVREIVGMAGGALDVAAASTALVANTAALADWPGRASVVPTTAGRDSRLVLAAAKAAGFGFSTVTGGAPDDVDVLAGRELARIARRPHASLAADPHGDMYSDWRRGARLLALQAAGTASLADAAGFPHGPRDGPLPLWHSGQGGEIARRYYGRVRGETPSALVASLYATFVNRRPGRPEVLNEHGAKLVRGEIAAFVDEVLDAGAAAADVGDLFYLLRRMGTWAGPTHGAVEWIRDTTSPLWSTHMLRHELAGTPRERARETFHLRLLERLAPELVDVPLQGGESWPARATELERRVRRALVLGGKVRSEVGRRTAAALRRRPARTRSPGPVHGAGEDASVVSTGVLVGAPSDPFVTMRDELRELAVSLPRHAAWRVLDADRVRALLSRDPAGLDGMSRYHVWRAATVFGMPLAESGH